MHKIHIDLIESDESAPNYEDETIEFHAVSGQLRIDGMPLLKEEYGYFLDFYLLLIKQDLAYPFNLYTCECGVAECVDIFETVDTTVTDTTIEWTFPEQFYNTHVQDQFKAENQPLKLVFDKKEYLQELNRVEKELIHIANTNPKLAVYPDYAPAVHCIRKETIEASLQRQRINYVEYMEKQILRKNIYGELLQSYIQLDFDTEIWTLRYEELADLYASYKGYDTPDEKQAYIKNTLVPELIQNQTNLLEYIKKLKPEVLQKNVCIDYTSGDPTADETNQPLPNFADMSIQIFGT